MAKSIIGFRGGLALGLVVLLAAAGGLLWWEHTKQQREIARLRMAIEHLTASYPIARIVVTEQEEDKPGRIRTRVRVRLVDEEGRHRGESMETELPGVRVYFEALLIVFADPLVQSGERRTMAFPTRLFTEQISPEAGFQIAILDARGVPVHYDRREPTPGGMSVESYREVLRRFWELANDPAAAAPLGIDVLQGQAVFTRYEVGRFYQVFVEADGGLTVRPEFHWLE